MITIFNVSSSPRKLGGTNFYLFIYLFIYLFFLGGGGLHKAIMQGDSFTSSEEMKNYLEKINKNVLFCKKLQLYNLSLDLFCYLYN